MIETLCDSWESTGKTQEDKSLWRLFPAWKIRKTAEVVRSQEKTLVESWVCESAALGHLAEVIQWTVGGVR